MGLRRNWLASRNEQYERFYLSSAARNLGYAHTALDRTRANCLVDRFLLEPMDEQPKQKRVRRH
jgi:hypothetical protein